MSMETTRRVVLDDDARQTLDTLADLLIPASDRMPSASQAGVGREWIDRAMAARPDWGADLAAFLQQARGKDARATLAELQAADRGTFTMLTEMVAGAYFMNPQIRNLIGYPGQQAVPAIEDPAAEVQDLLGPVLQRGAIYRPC